MNEGRSTLRIRTSDRGEQSINRESEGSGQQGWPVTKVSDRRINGAKAYSKAVSVQTNRTCRDREPEIQTPANDIEEGAVIDRPVHRGLAAQKPPSAGRTFFRFGSGGRRFGGLAALAAVGALAVLLPALLVQRGAPQAQDAADVAAAVHSPAEGQAGGKIAGSGREAADPDQTPVRVYLTRTGQVETLPLEEYVTGVLAAEMPTNFELAALKAQAIAARTFIVRRLAAGDTSGVPGGNADVNDTVQHQAYVSSDSLHAWKREGRGKDLQKLQQAVELTRGIIMTYQGRPITASFFSSSGGHTENSEDYWSELVPYLRSVSSPWELQLNPQNEVTVEQSVDEVFAKLGQQAPAISTLGSSGSKGISNLFKVLSVTAGGRVKNIQIGDKTYSGREVREKLELRSSQFTMELDGSQVKITTYGSGHGVGMSQWGANGMAKQGYTTTQILKHYYTGVSFNQVSDVLDS